MRKRKKSFSLLYVVIFLVFNLSIAAEQALAVSSVALLRTGQSTCYDGAGTVRTCTSTGEDGDVQAGVAWPSPRYEIMYCDESGPCSSQVSDCDSSSSTDIVTDTLTGLMLPRNGNLGTMEWIDAVTYANNFTLCGYSSWYLPNVIELESILNAGQSDSASWLNTQNFSGMQSNWYWSSTTYAYQTDLAWLIDMHTGIVEYDYKINNYNYVLPVHLGQYSSIEALWRTGQSTSYVLQDDGYMLKGAQWPYQRFDDNGDGTVTDNLTGLMWLRDADCLGLRTWQSAFTTITSFNSGVGPTCTGYTAGTYTNWRMPNRRELMSLIDFGDLAQYDGAILSGNPFLTVQSLNYWSSTSNSYRTDLAWLIDMWSGKVDADDKDFASYYVWPVRLGRFGAFSAFDISGIAYDQSVSMPFTVTIAAVDENGNALSDFSGSVNLSYSYGFMTPSTVKLTNGAAVFDATVYMAGDNAQITAQNGDITAYSNLFNVVNSSPYFNDISELPDVFQSAINMMQSYNITDGCGSGSYCADDFVTRAQMAAFILKAINLAPTDEDTCTGTMFYDVTQETVGEYSCKAIEKFAALNITSGCGSGGYCPNDPVTRAQMAVFILKAKGQEPTEQDTCSGTTFDDITDQDDYFCKAIEKFAALSITSGCAVSSYCPNDYVLRSQMALFITKGFLIDN
ncbi:secreted protein containing DUF1566 [Candidatus Magnetoovum chiemensis]|nr:secreted protein containing DUF1566 [Candidatus Magnetoovum chiemensis]